MAQLSITIVFSSYLKMSLERLNTHDYEFNIQNKNI